MKCKLFLVMLILSTFAISKVYSQTKTPVKDTFVCKITNPPALYCSAAHQANPAVSADKTSTQPGQEQHNRPIDYLVIIVLGALLGATGQGIRIIAGLKKLYDQANNTNQTLKDIYEYKQLIHSLMIALIIGAIAGILASIKGGDFATFSNTKALALIAAGYAGTDFIEGFMKTNSSGPAPQADRLQPTPPNIAPGSGSIKQ